MERSTEIKELAEAIAAAQAAIHPAVKDSVNPHFKNKYASLQAVWDAAKPVLTKNGLSVLQTFEPSSSGEVMNISTTLLHKSGQFMSGTLSIKPQRADPQGIGSAITYGRRYALAAILGIVADEDDDGEAASTPAKAVSSPAKAVSSFRHIDVPRQTGYTGWRAVKIGFGKKKGIPLGDLDNESIAWWDKNYQPKPKGDGSYWESDLEFRKALDEAASEVLGPVHAGEIDDSDIPF